MKKILLPLFAFAFASPVAAQSIVVVTAPQVDDSILPTERGRRLGAMVRELHEPLTATAGHDHGNGTASELTDETSARNLPHSLHATTEILRLSNGDPHE